MVKIFLALLYLTTNGFIHGPAVEIESLYDCLELKRQMEYTYRSPLVYHGENILGTAFICEERKSND